MSNRQRFEELLAGDLDGALTPAEARELEVMMAADPALAEEAESERAMIAMVAGLKAVKAPKGLVTTAVNIALPPAGAEIVPVTPVRRSRLPLGLVAAASVAALIAVSAFIGGDLREEKSRSGQILADAAKEKRSAALPAFAEDAAQLKASVAIAQRVPPSPAEVVNTASLLDYREGDAIAAKSEVQRMEPLGGALLEEKASVFDAGRQVSAPASVAAEAALGASVPESDVAGSSNQFAFGSRADASADSPADGTGPADNDSLPLPDRVTLAALLNTESSTLVADTWSAEAALRLMPTAADLIAAASALGDHRFALVRLDDPSRAPLVVADVNARFPSSAINTGEYVLIAYGPYGALGEVGSLGPGRTEFFPGPAPVREINAPSDIDAIAADYGGTPALSIAGTVLQYSFPNANDANIFLTAVERLRGPGSTAINVSQIELSSDRTDFVVTIPLNLK